jgi:hypothetical protein
MNNRDTAVVPPNVMNFQQSQEVMQEVIDNNNKLRADLSNAILYRTYNGLDSLNSVTKDEYGILKLEKDTTLYVDVRTKVKVPKKFYFQNNHDDTLKMAFKSPENLNVFIHDLISKEEVGTNLKAIKRSYNIEKFKEKSIGVCKIITYKVTKDKKRYNGYALCFKSKDYQTFFEFESNDLSSEKLKEKAIDFLTANLSEEKR